MALQLLTKPVASTIWDRLDVPFSLRALAEMVRDKKALRWEDAIRLVPDEVLMEADNLNIHYTGMFRVDDKGIFWLGEDFSDADPQEIEMLKILQTIPGYPYKYPKDLLQLREWRKRFPNVNIHEALMDWRVWLRNNEEQLDARTNYRSRFNTWLKNRANGYGGKKQLPTAAADKSSAELRKAWNF